MSETIGLRPRRQGFERPETVGLSRIPWSEWVRSFRVELPLPDVVRLMGRANVELPEADPLPAPEGPPPYSLGELRLHGGPPGRGGGYVDTKATTAGYFVRCWHCWKGWVGPLFPADDLTCPWRWPADEPCSSGCAPETMLRYFAVHVGAPLPPHPDAVEASRRYATAAVQHARQRLARAPGTVRREAYQLGALLPGTGLAREAVAIALTEVAGADPAVLLSALEAGERRPIRRP